MAGGTLDAGCYVPVVNCPYCGTPNNLHSDQVGTWVMTCKRTEQTEPAYSFGSLCKTGCGKEFVVKSERRVSYSTHAFKIEGQS